MTDVFPVAGVLAAHFLFRLIKGGGDGGNLIYANF